MLSNPNCHPSTIHLLASVDHKSMVHSIRNIEIRMFCGPIRMLDRFSLQASPSEIGSLNIEWHKGSRGVSLHKSIRGATPPLSRKLDTLPGKILIEKRIKPEFTLRFRPFWRKHHHSLPPQNTDILPPHDSSLHSRVSPYPCILKYTAISNNMGLYYNSFAHCLSDCHCR